MLRTCDLECQGKEVKGTSDSGNRHEFVGPVKIVLVESTASVYNRQRWYAALFTFVMLLKGATVFTVFVFTLNFKLPIEMNIHILLCTMGVCMPSGIMMLSSLFGGSRQLKADDKKFQHFFFEVSAVLFGVVGTVFALRNMSISWHALSGLFGAVLSVLTSLVGPTIYPDNPDILFGVFNAKAHRYIAVPTFILCTVCFALGLLKESFIKWSPCEDLHLILIAFTIIYSGTVLLCMHLRLHKSW